MKALAAALGGLLLAAIPSTSAIAATINFPPPQSPSFQNIASNIPAQGNVWTGLGQSFTDQDPHIKFGFYVGNFSGAASNGSVLFSLYAGGNGLFTNPLEQATATFDLSNFAVGAFPVDFSAVTLTPGDEYTVVASLPSQGLPTLGTASTFSLLYSGVTTNPYSGGRFFFAGGSYDESQFANRDLAFEVLPVTSTAPPSPTPEPSSLILLGTGVLGAVGAVRRKLLS